MNAPITVNCFNCYGPIEGERVSKSLRGSPCHFHPACWNKIETEQREAAARQLRAAQEGVRRSFKYSAEQPGLEQPVGGLPLAPYATLDNAEFRSRVSKKFLSAVERYDLTLNLMLLGPTGRGKTTILAAKMRKLCDDAIAAVKPHDAGPLAVCFKPRFLFLAGYELAVARRNWKLGQESPIVAMAKDIEFLILDELGFEPLTELPFEVIDHRYRAQRVTVVTTGLEPAEFRARYGDAAFRRIAEGGAVIEDW